MAVVFSHLGSMNSPAMVSWQVCSTRHEFLPINWALSPSRQLVVGPRHKCHNCTLGDNLSCWPLWFSRFIAGPLTGVLIGRLYSIFQYHESQAKQSLPGQLEIKPSKSYALVCFSVSNRVLPLCSVRQPWTVAIAYTFSAVSDSPDRHLKGWFLCLVLGFLFDSQWLLGDAVSPKVVSLHSNDTHIH